MARIEHKPALREPRRPAVTSVTVRSQTLLKGGWKVSYEHTFDPRESR